MSNIFLRQTAEFFDRFFRFGGTIKMVIELLTNDELMERWVKNLAAEPVFRLIHGRFTPLADKVEQVKSWPGINPADVDAAVEVARKSGLISGYEAESKKHDLLDIVITVHRESVPATLLYARERLQEAFPGKYQEWTAAYASGVDENRVKMIPGASFTPNCIKVEVVDLRANHDPKGVQAETIQLAQAGKLAGFAVLYVACQSPEWVRQINGGTVPVAIVAAILLNVSVYDEWLRCPDVIRDGQDVGLYGRHVQDVSDRTSFPVLREYRN